MFLRASFTSVILWIGDLNYRISDLDVDNVKELISKNKFETLHNYDQVISTTAPSLCYSRLVVFISLPCLRSDTYHTWPTAQEADRRGGCVRWLCGGRD